ncbi:MAG: glycosyltransferase [Bacillota bacterium]
MARILDCWELGNGLAYIEGFAASSKLLAKAGHEMSLAARDLSHAERLFGKHAKYYQAPTQVIPVSTPLPAPMTFADVLINLGFGRPEAVVARVRAWRNFFDLVKPDILRFGSAPGAMLAARGMGIRNMVLGIGFIVPPPVSPLPLLRTWAKNANPERMAAREAMVLAGMNEGLKAIGAPPLESLGALYADADHRVLYTYPELDDYGPRPDVKYLGILQAAAGEAPAWPDAPGKRIFVYLEAFKPVEAVLKGLADIRQPTLVYMPHPPEEWKTKYSSATLRITNNPVNMLRATAECDIGVNHGAHNSVATLLAAGKPQICLPTVFPERITGDKIAALGTGLVSRMETAEFGSQLAKLLKEPVFTEKARELGQRHAGLTMEAGMKQLLELVGGMIEASPKR